MPNGTDKQPWYSWLAQNRWPWEEPLPQDTTYVGFPFLQPRAMAKAGVPTTQRTRAIMQTPQYAAQEEYRRTIPAGLPAHLRPPSPQAEVDAAMAAAEPEEPSWLGAPPFPKEAPPPGYEWKFESPMGWIPVKSKVPAKMSAAERRQMELAEKTSKEAQEQQMWERMYAERETERAVGERAREQAWEQQQAQAKQAYQQQQMEQERMLAEQEMQWQREEAQMQQAEQERQYRSRLQAQPISWLEYASYTGEQPVLQPWQLPLMSGQYSDLQAGQPIPGWTGESASGMPAMTRPSAQYWSRMGPTAQSQFLGYKQARTGARPEESLFRMGASAPPSGRQGLRWTR